MFYAFGSTGRTFEGTLEALRRVEKTAAIRPQKQIADLSNADELPETTAHLDDPSGFSVSNKRTAQYRNMLLQHGEREVVYHAYQIMTQPAKCISSHWVLSQVNEYFRSFPFQAFPIVDQRQQLIGILSRSQFYEYLLNEDAKPTDASDSVASCFVSENSSVYCADPVTDVRRIATLLVENKLDAVPVVEEGGRLLGIVSRTDILKCTINDPPLSLWC